MIHVQDIKHSDKHIINVKYGDVVTDLQCTKEQLEEFGKQLFYEYGCIDWI